MIRWAGWGDLPVVVALERAIPELPHWSEAEYARYLGDVAGKTRLLLVAETEGSVCGFAAAAMGAADARMAELESLAVVPAERRGGVARMLCRGVMAWSRTRGAEVLELEVRSRSAGAIGLYGSLGFSRVGERPRYYADPPDDALLLALPLQADFRDDAAHL